MPFPPLPPIPPYQMAPLQGPISMVTPPRIHVAQYVRNGLVPHAGFETTLGASTNFVAAVRNKELFRCATPIANIPRSTGGTRTRWRFAARTSPLMGRLLVTMLVARQNSGDPVFSPKVTLYITNATETTTYGSATFTFGQTNPAAFSVDVPSDFGHAELVIEGVPADTPIYGRFVDTDCGRLIAATVYEESRPITKANGYVVPTPVAVQSPIYADRRRALYELGTNLWKKQGAHLFNWTVDDQASPTSNASATFKNIVDNAPTGATGPSWTLDTRYCGTRARPAVVPCVLNVYAKMSGSTDSGEITLTGAINGSWTTMSVGGPTPQWYTQTLDMPADLDNWYIEFYNPDFAFGHETISIYAASLYQYAS